MRIIAGTFRGRRLTTGRGLAIRPATDRARQTIFDILTHRIAFDGLTVLDLFAGTGSLGLESLSRGAAHTTFIESSRASVEVLEANIRSLQCQDRCTVYQSDVFRFLRSVGRSYDLVFADPPYGLPDLARIPLAIESSHVLGPTSFIIMEHPTSVSITFSPDRYRVTTRPFGQTLVVIAECSSPQ
jgi:16S rRNA (guanine966-N2)-methyltransferase